MRRVWRLEPDHFALKNPEWDRTIREIVAAVREELGLESQELRAHLYDLLVYEMGDFFPPHRDGEKLDRMVATLVVVLPSSHEGGELIVRHGAEEKAVDFSGPSADPFRIHYAAFYADCEHEVRPLKKGYRLGLVYNLTLSKSRKPIRAPRDADHIQKIAPLIRKWAEDEESTEKLAISLDHQYTQDGLSRDGLKGMDRVKARVLDAAARRADCRAYLALLTLHESGEGEELGGRYRYGRGRWYDRHRSRDDEGDEDEGGGRYNMVEVFDSDLTADHWSDPEGNRLPIGELTIEEDEVLDPDSLTGVTPEEDFRGYTGNEGSPLERWYRHAAVFLWPERRHFEVICSQDSRALVPELSRMVAKWKEADGKERAGLEARCRELASAIVARWPRQSHGGLDAEFEAGKSPAGRLLEALDALDAPPLIGDFLGGPLIADVTAEPGKALAAIGQKYGWSTLRPPLESAMRATTPAALGRNVRLLEAIATARPRKKAGWDELCAALADTLVAAISSIDRDEGPEEWRYRPDDRTEVLAGLVRSLLATGQTGLMSQFIDHALATPKHYPLTDVHIKAIAGLRPWLTRHVKEPSPALTRWLDGVRGQLEELTAREPQEPRDYRRAAPITCSCMLCTELKRFLEDPHEAVHRFPVRKELRRHLHSQIDAHRIDLIHETERRGSPQTLVCTKNTASYQASLKKYHEDRAHLEAIRAMQAALPG